MQQFKIIIALGFFLLSSPLFIQNSLAAPPGNVTNVNATAALGLGAPAVLVQWTPGANTTDIKIDRNGTQIVSSLLNEDIAFLSDDFSSYSNNATADLTWVKIIGGTDSSDDIVGVNATEDNIYFTTNLATSSRILLDLEALLNQNLTDNSGIGDFNMSWTHKLLDITPDGVADTGEMKIILVDRDAPRTQDQTGVSVGFFQRETGFTNQIFIRTAEDNTGFLGFESFDSNCGDGALTFDDSSPNDGKNDIDVTVYSTLTKVGQVLTYRAGTNPDYSGLGCSTTTTTSRTLDNLKFLKISRIESGSAQTDHGWRFDDFKLSVNGTLINLFKDLNVTKGTHYEYTITPVNDPPSANATDGNSTNSNVVKTHDIPGAVTGLSSNYLDTDTIFSDWDSLPINSGTGNPVSTPISLTPYQVYIRDSGIPPYVLAGVSDPLVSEFTHEGEAHPQEREIRVQSCNVLGCSANATATASEVVLAAVNNFNVTQNLLNQINGQWDYPGNVSGITGFTIYNSSNGLAPFSIVQTISNPQNFFNLTGLSHSFSSFFKVSYFTSSFNSTNSTVLEGKTLDAPKGTASFTLENVGDTFRFNVSAILDPESINFTAQHIDFYGNNSFIGQLNLVPDVLLTNGSTTEFSQSFYFQDLPPIETFDFRAEVDVIESLIDLNSPVVNATTEYQPNYFVARSPSEGLVNYTFPTNSDMKVNRDKGGTEYSIECNFISQSDAFLNKTGDTWINFTATGFYNQPIPPGAAYVACYNAGLLFITGLPTDFDNLLVPGVVIFDELGGLMGLPAVILLLLGLITLGTGRNFPTIAVIVLSVLGIFGALGLIVFTNEIWGLIMVLGAITVFTIRKFF